jgi:bifunctional non-homologous end joining protein LigD
MPAEVGVFVSEHEDREDREYLVVKDAAGFLALAQFGVVEFHPWGCRTDRPERPDRMFFDLDPGPDIGWRDIVAAAQMVREELARLDLAAFVKTSGGKGIHVAVPLKRLYSWDHVHKTSGRIAAALAGRHAATFTAVMAKERRKARIFIDIHRNARTATAAAAYSLRTRPGLPASAPVGWDELQSIDDPQDLNYASLPRLLDVRGDPWADLDARACTLGKEVMAKIAP